MQVDQSTKAAYVLLQVRWQYCFNWWFCSHGSGYNQAGMVPTACGIRGNSTFKDKFAAEERDSGLTNIVMGLLITEGDCDSFWSC